MSSIAKRPDGSWRARYRDAVGREYSKHHARKVDAQRWLDEATAGLVTGQWVDPRGGRTAFKEYAEAWRAVQVHRPSRAAHVETMLRRHAYPVLGDLPLSAIEGASVGQGHDARPVHGRRRPRHRRGDLPSGGA